MQALEADSGLLFGLLGQEPATASTLKLLAGNLFRRRPAGMVRFAGDVLPTLRNWLEGSFQSDLVRALIAPWVLHVGLGPEATLSAVMTKVVLLTLEAVGAPIVEGGSDNIVAAFKQLIEAHGGTLLTGIDVARVIVERGRGTGVESTDGRRFLARRIGSSRDCGNTLRISMRRCLRFRSCRPAILNDTISTSSAATRIPVPARSTSFTCLGPSLAAAITRRRCAASTILARQRIQGPD
jgi:hypothetical protein